MLKLRTSTTRKRSLGFTLIELLIAISLLMVLGLMLITSLREAISITSTSNAEGEVVTRVQSVLAIAERDLKAIAAGDAERFVTGQDPWGRQWFGFVRTMPEERSSYGGYSSGTAGVMPMQHDVWQGIAPSAERYAALGGMCEVVYFMEPGTGSTRLYRAILSPLARQDGGGRIGGGLIDRMLAWTNPSADPTPDFPFDAQAVADNVLYFGLRCEAKQVVDASFNSYPSQTTYNWDSDLLIPINNNARNGPTRPLGLPAQVQIEVTIEREYPIAFNSALDAVIDANEVNIALDNANGIESPGYGTAFVRIGSEWIEYTGVSGDTLLNCIRGARGTLAQAHAPTTQFLDPDWDPTSGEEQGVIEDYTPVRQGATYFRNLQLPCGR